MNEIKIVFTLKLLKYSFKYDVPDIKTYKILPNLNPYLVFLFDGSIISQGINVEMSGISSNLKIDEKEEHELSGVLNTKYKELPYDSLISCCLMAPNITDESLWTHVRIAECFLELRDFINGNKQIPMSFMNIERREVCKVMLYVKNIKTDMKMTKFTNGNIYYLKEFRNSIQNFTIKNVIEWSKNDSKLFKYYFNDTNDIFVKMRISIGINKPLNSFILFDDFDTNEEFWINLLTNTAIINMLELKYGKLNEHKESGILQLIDSFLYSLDKKSRICFIVDFFTLTACNLIYNLDNYIDYDGVKQFIEDFSNVYEGSGDCEDLARFIMYVFSAFMKFGIFDNKTLNFIRKEADKYIAFLNNAGVTGAAQSEIIEKDDDSTGSHMNVVFISKKGLFDGEKNEKMFGRIIFNPDQNNEDISSSLNNIYQYEKEKGNLDSTGYPEFLISEGTGNLMLTIKAGQHQLEI